MVSGAISLDAREGSKEIGVSARIKRRARGRANPPQAWHSICARAAASPANLRVQWVHNQ
jgi:hypothetical protein